MVDLQLEVSDVALDEKGFLVWQLNLLPVLGTSQALPERILLPRDLLKIILARRRPELLAVLCRLNLQLNSSMSSGSR